MSGPTSNPQIKLDRVSVLVLDQNQQALDIMGQVLSGFGVRTVQKCGSCAEALKSVANQPFDFIITDANLADIDGFDFIKMVRRMHNPQHAHIPIVLTIGHARAGHVHKARDSGANFVVAKPVVPKVLLERIFWVAREDRTFVEAPSYVGPERRFKREGPPIGKQGRRKSDLHTELREASTPNLSQDEINSMMKPMKVNF